MADEAGHISSWARDVKRQGIVGKTPAIVPKTAAIVVKSADGLVKSEDGPQFFVRHRRKKCRQPHFFRP
jgi:hypothetical protein